MSDYIKWIRSKVGHEPIILVGVCAIIENKNGDILLQKRSDNHTWCLPGGHMEIGETAEIAVKREVYEEMGVNLTVEKFTGIYTNRSIMTYPNGDQSFPIGIFLTGTIEGGLLINDEVLDVKYFSKDALPEDILEVHKEPLRDYINGQRGIIR